MKTCKKEFSSKHGVKLDLNVVNLEHVTLVSKKYSLKTKTLDQGIMTIESSPPKTDADKSQLQTITLPQNLTALKTFVSKIFPEICPANIEEDLPNFGDSYKYSRQDSVDSISDVSGSAYSNPFVLNNDKLNPDFQKNIKLSQDSPLDLQESHEEI